MRKRGIFGALRNVRSSLEEWPCNCRSVNAFEDGRSAFRYEDNREWSLHYVIKSPFIVDI